jgi:hypothetical protein
MAQYIESKSIQTYKEALKDIINLYNKAGFKITEITCDNEFCPLKNMTIENYDIAMNFTNPQEHVPEAEHNYWVIKK